VFLSPLGPYVYSVLIHPFREAVAGIERILKIGIQLHALVEVFKVADVIAQFVLVAHLGFVDKTPPWLRR
jgi:hypothetical protein